MEDGKGLNYYLKKNKKHIIYLSFILLLIVLFFAKGILYIEKTNSDERIYTYLPRTEVLRQSVLEQRDLMPLWNPFAMGGIPFFCKPDTQWLFSIVGPLALLLPSIAAVNITMLLYILIACIAMYILVYYLTKIPEAALISAIVYGFNGWIISKYMIGHLTTVGGYAIIPFIILFTMMAFKSKSWIFYSILAGIFVSLQIWLGPDLKVTLWTMPIVALYLALSSFGKNFTGRAIKAGLIIFLLLGVTFGLTAVKMLPGKEYLDSSSRQKVPLEHAMSRKLELKDAFNHLIEPYQNGFPKIRHSAMHKIGIVSFILILAGLYLGWRRRNIIYFLLTALFSMSLATGSFVFRMLRNIPPYDSFRYLERTLSIFEFGAAALAGLGFFLIYTHFKNKGWNAKKLHYFFLIIVGLIIIDLMIFGENPYRFNNWQNPDEMLADNEILQYLSNQDGYFRIQTYETTGIDWGTDFQNIPLRLEHMYGYEGVWLTEYMNEYLGIGMRDKAKFWGIMNVKYVTSQSELNVSGLEFYQKFEPCEICFPDQELIQKISGPYLYVNNQAMPRYYIMDKAILIVGERESAKQTMYAIMLLPQFDPKKNLIILGKAKISNYDAEELSRYSAVVLTKDSVDQSDSPKLSQYVSEGGALIPDITKGETTASQERMVTLLNMSSSYEAQDDSRYQMVTFDERRVKIDPDFEGFVVLSEIFSLFPGWKAESNGKDNPIMRANGVVSAIYVEGDEELYLRYMPRSFVIGAFITVFTVFLLLLYFGFVFYKNHKKYYEKADMMMNGRLSKHGKSFSQYLIVGVVWTILTIFCLWLFIDILGFSAFIGSTIVTIALFVFKYYIYRFIGLMKKDFVKYSVTSLAFVVVFPPLMWLFVDIIGISTVISSTILTVGLFVLRFVAFNKLGLINEIENQDNPEA